MKKLLATAAVIAATATSAFAVEGCDNTVSDGNGGWALVVHNHDSTYFVMTNEAFVTNAWSIDEPPQSLIGAYAIKEACDMPAGSVYFPNASHLDELQNIGDDIWGGYWSAVSANDSITLD